MKNSFGRIGFLSGIFTLVLGFTLIVFSVNIAGLLGAGLLLSRGLTVLGIEIVALGFAMIGLRPLSVIFGTASVIGVLYIIYELVMKLLAVLPGK